MSLLILSNWIRHHVSSLTDLVFPPTCLSCYRGGHWLCERCQTNLPRMQPGWCGRCDRIALPGQSLCRSCRQRLGLTALWSPYRYESVAEQLVLAAKFQGATVSFDELLGAVTTVPSWLTDHRPRTFVPLPASAVNERKRGYNQTERLARSLALRARGATVDQLERTREAAPQVGLSPAARRRNVEGLYRWRGQPLDRTRVVLVDDVSTTGASLSEAARAVRAAGARRVYAVVLAQTPRGKVRKEV